MGLALFSFFSTLQNSCRIQQELIFKKQLVETSLCELCNCVSLQEITDMRSLQLLFVVIANKIVLPHSCISFSSFSANMFSQQLQNFRIPHFFRTCRKVLSHQPVESQREETFHSIPFTWYPSVSQQPKQDRAASRKPPALWRDETILGPERLLSG